MMGRKDGQMVPLINVGIKPEADGKSNRRRNFC